MDIVMFHSGVELPVYLEYTFKQIRLFNPDVAVWFITDKEHLENPVFKNNKINVVNKGYYTSEKVQTFEFYFKRKPDDFWTITATRLIYIENFLQLSKLTDVYHFENDVLLYYDLKEHHKTFVSFFNHMAITPGGSDKVMTGFMFIKDWVSLAKMTEYFINVLEIHGINGLIKRHKMDMVNEMTLMKIFADDNRWDLQYIPTLPAAKGFELFNSIFDPASWGQYVGGTVDGIPGAKPDDHYIGQILIQHPEYSVVWVVDDKGRKIPHFKYGENLTKINNLHIHSKNLHKYVS